MACRACFFFCACECSYNPRCQKGNSTSWSELVKKREKIAYDKDRIIDAWTRKLQDKINSIERENIKLAKQLKDSARCTIEPVNGLCYLSRTGKPNGLHTMRSQNIVFTMRSIHGRFNVSNLQTVGKVLSNLRFGRARAGEKRFANGINCEAERNCKKIY